jgi:hypothetical protein
LSSHILYKIRGAKRNLKQIRKKSRQKNKILGYKMADNGKNVEIERQNNIKTMSDTHLFDND